MDIKEADAYIHEAQEVGQEAVGGVTERIEGRLVRNSQLQNHDGDDDGS